MPSGSWEVGVGARPAYCSGRPLGTAVSPRTARACDPCRVRSDPDVGHRRGDHDALLGSGVSKESSWILPFGTWEGNHPPPVGTFTMATFGLRPFPLVPAPAVFAGAGAERLA